MTNSTELLSSGERLLLSCILIHSLDFYVERFFNQVVALINSTPALDEKNLFPEYRFQSNGSVPHRLFR